MKKIFILLFPVIIFFFFTIFLPQQLIRELPGIEQESGQFQSSLIKNKTYTYQFHHRPNLNSVSIQLKNPLIANNSQIIIHLEDQNGQNLAEFIFFGSNVGDPSWLSMDFPPLPNTEYQLSITTDNTVPESLFLLSDSHGNWDLKTTYAVNQVQPHLFLVSSPYVIAYLLLLIFLYFLFIFYEK